MNTGNKADTVISHTLPLFISRSQQELRQQTRDRQEKLERESSQHALDSDEMGPIRIRNLEDLIR